MADAPAPQSPDNGVQGATDMWLNRIVYTALGLIALLSGGCSAALAAAGRASPEILSVLAVGAMSALSALGRQQAPPAPR